MAMNLQAVLRIGAQVQGTSAVEKLGLSLIGVGKAADGALNPLSKMTGGLRGLSDIAATVGLAALGRSLMDAGLESQAADRRISALADTLGETNAVQALAAKAADQFALASVDARNAVADLYGRLRPMGVTLQDIETVFFGVNKAAKMMGLTGHDTSEVLLQLSQALGSGKLQGDELRSIMERMPAVGQAVAKVMGVSASEIKKLGSEGKITTEVMIRAAAELQKLQPPPPTAMEEFNAALKDLQTELGENLLPVLTPIVAELAKVAEAFGALPEPVQNVILALGAFVIAAGPIASVITGIGKALVLLSGLQIGATIAGWLGAIGPVVIGIQAAFTGLLAWLTGTLLPALVGIFSGPVGWTVLAVAAVVAMVALFRKPIMDFFSWLGRQIGSGLQALWAWGEPIRQFWQGVWNSVVTIASASLQAVSAVVGFALRAALSVAYLTFVQPWVTLWNVVLRKPVSDLIQWLSGAWKAIGQFFTLNVAQPLGKMWKDLMSFLPNAFKAAVAGVRNVALNMVNIIRNAVRNVLQFIADRINFITRRLNVLISANNRLSPIKIPVIPTLSVPRFAKGGYVTSATLAQIGEGGEPEYVIPESKMARASANYLTGGRGAEVLSAQPPMPSATATPATGGAVQIDIRTGPVVEMDGTRYVSVADLERAMRITAEGVIGRLRTPSARLALGLQR